MMAGVTARRQASFQSPASRITLPRRWAAASIFSSVMRVAHTPFNERSM
jgi:hypothetical protein